MNFRARTVTALTAAVLFALPAQASAGFLFWTPPNFAGAPVNGDEPGIGLPMPDATPAETRANMLWAMRAGLNVAALQCQFSPALMTVSKYNDVLKHHSVELNDAYKAISAYFKRTGGKKWQTALDQYTTRTYNGFSTLYAQLGFCDTAGAIGAEALTRPKGQFYQTAATRMREFRNSLVPIGERMVPHGLMPIAARTLPPLDPKCWDRKNRIRKQCVAV